MLPTGRLRAAYISGNPVQTVTDPVSGELLGPAAELARALARNLAVALDIAGAKGPLGVIERLKNGEADIGFLAFDPKRAGDVDFSQTYALGQNSYVVPAASPLRSVAEVDAPGRHVGVGEGDAGDFFLSRTLRHATLVRVPAGHPQAAAETMLTGAFEAFAANRQRLSELVARDPRIRLLPDNFYGVEQCIVVGKGNGELLGVAERVIERARASGLIEAAIKRAGLVGVDVAPSAPAR